MDWYLFASSRPLSQPEEYFSTDNPSPWYCCECGDGPNNSTRGFCVSCYDKTWFATLYSIDNILSLSRWRPNCITASMQESNLSSGSEMDSCISRHDCHYSASCMSCGLDYNLCRLPRTRKANEEEEEEKKERLRHMRRMMWLLIMLLSCLLQGLKDSRQLSGYRNRARPPCTTMPWCIPPALVVLWGVCWMFYPSALGKSTVIESCFSPS